MKIKSINLTSESRKKFHYISEETGKQIEMSKAHFGIKWHNVRTLQGFFLDNKRDIESTERQLKTATSNDMDWQKLLKRKIADLQVRQSDLFEEILEWKQVANEANQTIPDLDGFKTFLSTIPKFLHEKEEAIRDLQRIDLLKEIVKDRFDVFFEFLSEWVKEEENSLITLNLLANLRGKKVVSIPKNATVNVAPN